LTDDVYDQRITTNEAINRSNVYRFVMARESYDYDLMYTPVGDWRLPYLMATGPVTNELRALHARNNPANPLNAYGKSTAIRVRILSTVLQRSPNGRYVGATVRFQRTLFDKKSGGIALLDNKIATLTFSYNDRLKISDADRVQNPLGFQVTSYRVDNDAAALPPGEFSQPTTRAAALQPPGLDPATGNPAAVDADGVPVMPNEGASGSLQVPNAQSSPQTFSMPLQGSREMTPQSADGAATR
jgi:type IV secretion system protein VirB8